MSTDGEKIKVRGVPRRRDPMMGSWLAGQLRKRMGKTEDGIEQKGTKGTKEEENVARMGPFGVPDLEEG